MFLVFGGRRVVFAADRLAGFVVAADGDCQALIVLPMDCWAFMMPLMD